MTQSTYSAKDIAESLVRLPQAFRTSDKSIYELVYASGYFDRASEVKEDLIRACLSALPMLVDDWLEYSEDKRTTTGWYFQLTARGFEVGHWGGTPARRASTLYDDKLDACAKFIKNELEDIRHSAALPGARRAEDTDE